MSGHFTKAALRDGRPELRRGSRLKRNTTGDVARVMTITEGWVVMRFTGAAPFMVLIKDAMRDYTLVKR